MNAVPQVLTIVEGLALAIVGLLQAFSFRDQRFHPFFLIRPEDTEAVRPWAIDVASATSRGVSARSPDSCS